MPDILAIVSKAVFEKDARIDGKPVALGHVWPVDRYNSTNKALSRLEEGGRIFLVTVRPSDEALWLVGVVEQPAFDGSAWVGKANRIPATNISALRKTIRFESGKGMSQEKGTLGMSLQTPRALTPDDDPNSRYRSAEELLADLKKELPGGTRLDASVVPAAEIVGVRDAVPMELASTELAALRHGGEDGTMRSPDGPAGIRAVVQGPADDRKG